MFSIQNNNPEKSVACWAAKTSSLKTQPFVFAIKQVTRKTKHAFSTEKANPESPEIVLLSPKAKTAEKGLAFY